MKQSVSHAAGPTNISYDWFMNDFSDSTLTMSGSEFQAQLLQSVLDIWMASASLKWGDWLEYIEKMHVEERMQTENLEVKGI
jgi:hypothetical protein